MNGVLLFFFAAPYFAETHEEVASKEQAKEA